MTKFAPHEALKSIARSMLTFDDRVVLHRVGGLTGVHAVCAWCGDCPAGEVLVQDTVVWYTKKNKYRCGKPVSIIDRAIPVKVAAKRLPVFPFSGLLKGCKGHKTHRFENGATNQIRKTGKREVVLPQPLPESLYEKPTPRQYTARRAGVVQRGGAPCTRQSARARAKARPAVSTCRPPIRGRILD